MDNFFKQNIVSKAASVAGVTRPSDYLHDKTETASVCREFIDVIIKSCISRARFDEVKKSTPLTRVVKYNSTTHLNEDQPGYQLPPLYASICGVTLGCQSCCSELRLDPHVTFTILNNQLILTRGNCCCDACGVCNRDLVYTTWDINVEQLPADLTLAMVYFLAAEITNKNQGHMIAIALKREAEQYLSNSMRKQIGDYTTPVLECSRPFIGTGRKRL